MFIILIILLILFSLYIGIESIKQKLYYYPNINCENYNNNFDNIFIDDDKIHAWYSEYNPTDDIIFYCHGNSGNIGSRTHIIDMWNKQGFSIFIFDYPGYGLSKGTPSENKLYKCGEKSFEYLLNIKPKNKIILYGESIGCSVASHLAVKYKIDKLVLQSGFSSMKNLSHDILPSFLYFLGIFVYEFDISGKLLNYNGDVMLLHSKSDEIIPYKHAKILKNHTNNLYTIQGTHNNPIFDLKKIINFINQ